MNQAKKGKRIISIMLTLIMALTMLPMTAFAASAGSNIIDMGDPTITSGDGWSFAPNVYTIHNGANVTITGDNGTSRRSIVVSGTANITLQDVTIRGGSGLGDDSPLLLTTGSNVTLNLVGINTLTTGATGYGAGIQAPAGTTLTIGGTGTLNVTGGLNAAGIGGAQWSNGGPTSGSITINGGVVNAIGGGGTQGGAGIGSTGLGDNGVGGSITITAGVVNATGGAGSNNGGAGIGGGGGSGTGTVIISGGTVNAIGGRGLGASSSYNGPGIGSPNTFGGTINISGGEITAIAGDNGTNPAIGNNNDTIDPNITGTWNYWTNTTNSPTGAIQGAGVFEWDEDFQYIRLEPAFVSDASDDLSAAATGVTGQVELTWTIPDDNNSDITGFIIQYSPSSADAWTTVSPTTITPGPYVAGNSIEAFIDGLTGGQAYDFRVAAVNGIGTGAWSNIATATPDAAPAGTAPTITTTSLENGMVGIAYSQDLAATGTAPVTWSITAGNLPAGLSLDGANGEISGTPTAAGTFTFTVQAANGFSPNATKALTITIGAPDDPVGFVADLINGLPSAGDLSNQADVDAAIQNIYNAWVAFNSLTDEQKDELEDRFPGFADDLEDIIAQIAKINHTVTTPNGTITVDGSAVPWNVRLEVDYVPTGEEERVEFLNELSDRLALLYLYNIEFVYVAGPNTGEAWQPPAGTSVAVTISGLDLQGATRGILIAHMKGDGTMEYITPASITTGSDGKSSITFVASSFSLYGVTVPYVAGGPGDPGRRPEAPYVPGGNGGPGGPGGSGRPGITAPKTGDPGSMALMAWLGLVSPLAAWCGISIARRKKNKESY